MRVLPVSDRIKEAPAQALRGVFAGIGQLLLITDKLRNKTPADQHVPQARGPEPAKSAAEAHEVTVVRKQEAAPEAAEAGVMIGAAEADVTVETDVTEVPPAAEPKAAGLKAPKLRTPQEPTGRATEIRDFDKSGNVRLLPDTGGAAKAASAQAGATVPAAQAASEPQSAVAEPPAAAAAVEATGTMAAAAGPAAGAGAVEAPLPNYGELSIASLRARLRNLDIGQVRQLSEYEKGHAGRADVIAMFERRIAKLEAGD